jgi:hypothetical protein
MSLTAILCVLIAIRFVPEGNGADGGEGGVGERLSLMTLNSPSWYPYDGDRARDLLRLMNRYRPDIVAIPEGWVNYNADGSVRSHRKDLRVLTDSASYVTRGPRGTRDTVSHTPLYSLFPFEQVSFFELPYDPTRQYSAKVSRASVTWRQRPIVVYGVHMQSFGSEKPWREDNSSAFNPRVWLRYVRQYRQAIHRRAAQAEQLARMIREETDPVIVMGDLNSTSNNWDLNWIKGDLTDAYRVSGEGWGATYHARRPFARIDFILVSEEFRVVSAEVPAIGISDHRPVFAVVEWRK